MNHFSFFSLEPTGYTQTVTYIIYGQICTGLFLCALPCSGTWALGRHCFVEVIKLIEIQLLPAVRNYAANVSALQLCDENQANRFLLCFACVAESQFYLLSS